MPSLPQAKAPSSAGAARDHVVINTSAASTISPFRRPSTQNSLHFYYISQSHWDELVAAAIHSADKQKAKTALNHLRKFDIAGRIMETDEDKKAPTPCNWCTRPGNSVECRVFVDKEKAEACAYCRLMGKAGCKASKEPVEEPAVVAPASAEELAQLRAVVAEQGEAIKRQAVIIQQQGQQLRHVTSELTSMGEDMSKVWEAFWPSEMGIGQTVGSDSMERQRTLEASPSSIQPDVKYIKDETTAGTPVEFQIGGLPLIPGDDSMNQEQ